MSPFGMVSCCLRFPVFCFITSKRSTNLMSINTTNTMLSMQIVCWFLVQLSPRMLKVSPTLKKNRISPFLYVHVLIVISITTILDTEHTKQFVCFPFMPKQSRKTYWFVNDNLLQSIPGNANRPTMIEPMLSVPYTPTIDLTRTLQTMDRKQIHNNLKQTPACKREKEDNMNAEH